MTDKKKLHELIETSKEAISANDHAIQQNERVISIAQSMLGFNLKAERVGDRIKVRVASFYPS